MSNEGAPVGKYHRLVELGRGGMAIVYLAAMRGPQGFTKLVVLKEALAHLAQDPVFRRMFLDEARLAARLNHPNIVQTYEVGEEAGRQFIVMEHLEGQPLVRVRELPLPFALFVVSNVLSGLEHAHELRGLDGELLRVVHRDVSPHNVFVTYSGEVKLVDFGIAKAADVKADTNTGVLKGKVRYMAPEQARGEAIDGRADLFAVGAILYELVTGQPLWGELPDFTILLRLGLGQMPNVADVAPHTDPRLRAIVMRALASTPAERYATASAMLVDVDAYLATLGEQPTRRALGARMARAFEGARRELNAFVDAQLRAASLPKGGAKAPRAKITDVKLTLGRALPPSITGATDVAVVHPPTPASQVTVARRPRRVVAAASIGVALLVALGVGGLLVFRRMREPSSVVDPDRLASFAPLPPPEQAGDEKTRAEVQLGRTLFHDPLLSNGGKVACTSCHSLATYGVDNQRLSRGSEDREPPRNSSSVYNLGGLSLLLWDGRKDNLIDQAKEVLQSPRAMATTPGELTTQLLGRPDYVSAFARAFPDEAAPVTFDNTARSLAAYEATLMTRGARWDRFLEGDRAALSDREKAGFNRFVDVGCVQCHFGTYVGATTMQKLGLVKAWPDTRDRGRYETTKREADWMVFRAASLRNVTETAPYFHDGSVTSLDEAIRLMARHQIGKELGDDDVSSIAGWLATLKGEVAAGE